MRFWQEHWASHAYEFPIDDLVMNFPANIRMFSPSLSLAAWLVAVGVVAWVAADLFWRVAAPPPAVFPVVAESDAGRAAQAVAGRHFMGESALAAVRNEAGRFALFGVVTGDEKRPGFAVLAVDGGAPQGVVAGQEVLPGVVLARIFADHVELRSDAGTQNVSLSPGAATNTGGGPVVANQSPSLPPPSEMPTPPPGPPGA